MNIQQLIQQIQSFNGDPNKMLSQIMSSGRYTPEQIEEAKKQATKIESALNVLGFKGR